jgi:hypothetical protein
VDSRLDEGAWQEAEPITEFVQSLQDRPFTADVFGAQIKYAYSTKLYFGAYVQYNAATDQVVTNLRMNFVHAPLSDLFIVYNERREMTGGFL